MATLEALGFHEIIESAIPTVLGSPPRQAKTRTQQGSREEQPRDQQAVSPGLATDRDQRSIYVSNLGPGANKQQLQQLFSPCGDIRCITIPLNPDTQQPHGHAYIEFSSPDEAAAAVKQLHGRQVQGRAICVQHKRTNIRGYEVFHGHLGFSRRGRRGGRLGASVAFGFQGAAFPDWGRST